MLGARDLVQLFQLGLEVCFLSLEMEDGRFCNLGEGGRGGGREKRGVKEILHVRERKREGGRRNGGKERRREGGREKERKT